MNRNPLKRLVPADMLALCAIHPAVACAAGLVTAKVRGVRVDGDGKGMVVFDQPIGGTPAACATPAHSSALAFGGTCGRQVLAYALDARLSNRTITVYGAGTCSTYGGSYVEDWSYGNY